jgi:hypothetical protein
MTSDTRHRSCFNLNAETREHCGFDGMVEIIYVDSWECPSCKGVHVGRFGIGRSVLGDRIRSEANIADRPGQFARLEQIAREVDALEAVRG